MIRLFDSAVNKDAVGHEKSYNTRLLKVLAKVDCVEVTCPFESTKRSDKTILSLATVTFFSILCTVLKKREVVIFPSPTSLDIISLSIIRRFVRSAVIFFHRREVAPTDLKSKLLYRAILRIVTSAKFQIVSDSNFLVKKLQTKGGALFIPVPPIDLESSNDTIKEDLLPLTHNEISNVYTFLGELRREKGIDFYIEITETILEVDPTALVLIHAHNRTEALVPDWSSIYNHFLDNKRVLCVDRRLSDSEYGLVVKRTNALLLPYDVVSYAGGTAGPFYEMIGQQKFVISTKIDSAFEDFEKHPKVIWLDELSKASFEFGIKRFLMEANKVHIEKTTDDAATRFETCWVDAVRSARRLLN